MFNPTRDQARQFFIDAWRKRRDGNVISGMEAIAADLVAEHPEYHALLESTDAAQKEFSVEDGLVNPFLHLSLHLAIHEQLSINQPEGLRDAYDLCLARHSGDRHAALHDVLEALGETIHEAQHSGSPPDGKRYVEKIIGRSHGRQ